MKRRTLRCIIHALEPRRHLSAGDLDLSFSGDGLNVIDLAGSTNEIANATVVQSDGKVLLAGRATVGAETDFFIARLLASGNIDTTFGGGDGFITVDFAVNDEAQDLAIDSSDRIVVVGTSSTGAGSNARDFAVARLTNVGVLDTTFSGDGKTTVDFGVNDDAMSVALDGTAIYVGGYKDLGSTGHFALAKLLSNGSPDTSFSTDGEVFFGFGGSNDSRCYDIAIDDSSRVVMVGYDEVIGGGNGRNYAYARVGTNALVDSDFSGDGMAVTDFASGDDEARAVGIDPRGNIVVGGFSDGTGGDDFTATRLSDAGALDSSFNGDGAFRLNIGGVEAVDDLVVHPDGDITLCGQTSVGSFQAALVRLSLGAGVQSASFGDGADGVQLINFGAIDDGFALALDPRDLRAVVAGTDGSGKLAVARVHDLNDRNYVNATANARNIELLPDGSMLAISGGLRHILPDGSNDAAFQDAPAGFASDFTLDNNGRIVLVDTEQLGTENDFIRVRRLLSNGAPDTTFSGDGVFDFQFENNNNSGSIARAVTVDSFNRIVIGGIEGSQVSVIITGKTAVARLTTAGALDTGFDGDGINVLATSSTDDLTGIAIDSSGRIVTVGTSGNDAQVCRFTASGGRDNSFGILGVHEWGFGVNHLELGRDLAFDSSGRILVGGYDIYGIQSDSQAFVSRLTASGDLDDTFDSDGSILLAFRSDQDAIERIKVDEFGRIVTVGEAFLDGDYHTIVRRLIPGAAVIGDNTFASDGVWVDPQGKSSSIWFHAVDLDIDGAIYVAGGDQGVRRLNVDPTVTDFDFLFETSPQRLQVHFNDDVGDSLVDADLLIRNLTTNTIVQTTAYDVQAFDSLNNVLTVNFNSILADGNYTVEFSSTGIVNNQGMRLAGDRVKDFFFLRGDANHDGRANLADFNIVTANYGQSNRTYSQGDFNYDGQVNLADYNILAGKFGTALGAQVLGRPGVFASGDEILDELL